MWIQIFPGSEHPIYLQVVNQISEAIAKKEIGAGDKLPTVRSLAQELVINPNTISKAYKMLEQRGLIYTKAGSGTFVKEPTMNIKDASDLNLLQERMDTIISRGINLGLKPQEICTIFENRMKKFQSK